MADTLRSLAGDIFRSEDVLSYRHALMTPEELVLDRYVFMPHARTGIAAALTAPFDWSLPTKATVDIRVPVIDDRGAVDAEMTVHVHGPADVTELDHRQVIRTFPKADAADAEIDDLVHIEFDRPDMPWLFTPTGPDGAGRLVPWITLVVTERRHIEWGEQRGTTRRAQIRRDQLQSLGDAWAWAHAQVMGAKPADAMAEPTLDRRLAENNAAHNLSRLVCPRRLDDRTSYVACVVPTFLAGAQTGLGLTPASTLNPAWGTVADFGAGDPLDMVALPVYYSWNFSTAEDGNFESLARKVRPAVAPPGVGRRRVDATRPWPELTLDRAEPGAEVVVSGPVVSPQAPESAPEEQWPTEDHQRWQSAVANTLVDKLNQADVQAHAPDRDPRDPPLVGPPLYGSAHARQPRLETDEPASSAQPLWFRELNLDPRHRIVAGLGTRVVQAEQEDLMVSAWNQVAGIEAANKALRLAQLAKHVGASLHRRHLSRLSDAAVITVTDRVHAKIIDAPQRSVWASIGDSSLPRAVTTGAFRRLARTRGPIVRLAVTDPMLRERTVAALAVLDDRLTTDWVQRYVAPDGLHSLSATAAALITDEIASRVSPGLNRETLLRRWDGALSEPAPSDRLGPDDLSTAQVPDEVDVGRELIGSLIRRIVRASPIPDEMSEDPEAAITGAGHGFLLRNLVDLLSEIGNPPIDVSSRDAERLGLEIIRESEDAHSVEISAESLLGFAELALEMARGHDIDVPFDEFEQDGARLRELAQRGLRIDGRSLRFGLERIGERVVLNDPFADNDRRRIDAPALQLVAKLDPATTVPARINARLSAGTGRMPGWLQPGWFGDGQLEPVMAHPHFRYPMYEPLHRYDRDWMVPGLGLLERPDMATLLQTNNRFIEGYLVGLNHEMGRELLWREFPTDQRGTYFASFWTGANELVAELHEPAWRTGALGSHVDPALDGQLVFLVRGDLVRRYPGLVAHAAREFNNVDGIPVFDVSSPIATLFHAHMPPNVLLVGFAMTKERIATPGETWWFILSENPTEPRFGLDPSRNEPISRDSLVWTDFGVDTPGGFLDATLHTDLAFEHSTWGASSAQVAHLLFQLPARAAFLASKMVAGATR